MDTLNIISFVIGVISLILTLYYGNQSRKTYHLLMSNFDQKAMEVLYQTLEKGRLSNANQSRGLIKNVSVEYEINMPSDEYIVRILRRMAIRYEQDDKDERQKLLTLERIRKQIEPKGPPLMSIASINRFAAFQIIMGGAIVSLITFQFLYLPNSNVWILDLAVVILEVIIAVAMYGVSVQSKKLLNKAR